MSKKNATSKVESETPNVDSEIEAIEKAKALLATARAKLSPEAKAALAEKEKAEKAARAKKESRTTAAVKALATLNGEPRKIADLVKAADDIYVQGGGPSNEKEASYNLRRTIAVEVALGLIVEQDGTVAKK